MPFEEDISNFFSNAKWKVTQQAQILKMQAELTDMDRKISVQKTVLGEKAYESFEQGDIDVAILNPVCLKIQELYAQKALLQQDLEVIRQQDPPAGKSSTPEAPSEVKVESVDSFDDEAPLVTPSEDQHPIPSADEDGGWVETDAPSKPADS